MTEFEICVNTEELDLIKISLNKEVESLKAASSSIRNQLLNLSCNLEGRQFLKANKITNESCNILNETTVNIELLTKHLDNLESCIVEYYNYRYVK